MTHRPPLRLAFTHISSKLWSGGYNYQRNLFAALNRYRRDEFAPVVFAGVSADGDDLAAFAAIPKVEVVQAAAFDRRRFGLVSALLTGNDRAALAAFREHNIDAVIENARFFGWRLPYPAVAWFPDFQHRRLPQLFSPVARWRRDIGFRVQIAAGRIIMLSSQSALEDCEAFYPNMRGKASVVRFATQPSAELLTADPLGILDQYKLPRSFFYLPNQFWRHKNHQVVIDALAILASRGLDVVVAASGSKDDPREPDYFESLERQVYARALTRNFRYLGMIPMPHVYALLRVCTAMLNPSRFEGWSTTVEEAKSFGVPMILSDLKVHREQTSGTACYFETDDPLKLADHLAGFAQNPYPISARDLLQNLDTRVSTFASDFAQTVQRAFLSAR
ncbi:glycosyltransferase involved in cell wall biosynthesis [Nitrobacter vulgaris]|uniref:glycosyltransferase n=1 Tax=Nitrobacter vulgaris TaxID=29421 RepID=UPI0028660876|nr:glycosyltransferase [Nitrobacter vulgaris]MDR6304572.1 glycosyltransferase involved in cell wall biosynthesis [Nitrobacter vulgaris]